MAVGGLWGSQGRADAPAERMRLEARVKEAAVNFTRFCAQPDVWKYDNLREPIRRALAPVGTAFQPPQVPVVLLSPGSAEYQKIVGEMMYLYYVWFSRQQRLAEFMAREKSIMDGIPRSKPPRQPADDGQMEVDDEMEFTEELYGTEIQVDKALGNYGRACGCAWPYTNLRPLCKLPGLQPANLLNPLIRTPIIGLSEASPDYADIVSALSVWQEIYPVVSARLKDLIEDQKTAGEAAQTLKKGGMAVLPDPNVPPEDPRLAEMFTTYQELKTHLRQTRRIMHKVEKLTMESNMVKSRLAALQQQSLKIQREIFIRQQKNAMMMAEQAKKAPPGPTGVLDLGIVQLQQELAHISSLITQAQSELRTLEKQIQQTRDPVEKSLPECNRLTATWLAQCDLTGKLEPESRDQTLTTLNQWLTEEPRLWHLYLARAAVYHHGYQDTLAWEDLKRLQGKLRLYGISSQDATIGKICTTWLRGETQKNPRPLLEKLFDQLSKLVEKLQRTPRR
ncbi:MAG: hypothetical protein NZ602_04290 [Thermoguttaceae bacterium]|nr:hypothetical protein [Thermoguttaceae bacterium]MDW8039200.1 hypothetical protein [Thermoguttaceae bacterium]